MTITIPTVLGFLWELRRLKKYLPRNGIWEIVSNRAIIFVVAGKSGYFQEGETIFEQGDLAQYCYVLTKGCS